MDAPYTITKNKDLASPVLYDSPHSGSTYPDDFNYACDFKNLKNAEDNFVEDLFAHVPQTGSAFLQAHLTQHFLKKIGIVIIHFQSIQQTGPMQV